MLNEEYKLIRANLRRIDMQKGGRYQHRRYLLTYNQDIDADEYKHWVRVFRTATVNQPELLEFFPVNEQGINRTLVFWECENASNIKGSEFFVFNGLRPLVQVVSDVDLWDQLIEYMQQD
jgi:hypothetical protein